MNYLPTCNLAIASNGFFTRLGKDETLKSLKRKRDETENLRCDFRTQQKSQKMLTQELEKNTISDNARLLLMFAKQLQDDYRKLQNKVEKLGPNFDPKTTNIDSTIDFNMTYVNIQSKEQANLLNVEPNLEPKTKSIDSNIDSDMTFVNANIQREQQNNIKTKLTNPNYQSSTLMEFPSNLPLPPVSQSSALVECVSSNNRVLVESKGMEENCKVPRNNRNNKQDSNNLEMRLNAQRRLKWKEMFTLLVKFKSKRGNCNVPHRHKEAGENLETWLTTQRQFKKKGKLDCERQSQLEELGVVWDLPKYKWGEMFTLLVEFKRRTGNCNVAQSHKEAGRQLGTWLMKERKLKKEGKQDCEIQGRLDQLEELGVVWDVLKYEWEELFTLYGKVKIRR